MRNVGVGAWVRALGAVLLLSVGLVAADATPSAGQQAPQVLVYPFHLADGEPTVLYATGFPEGYSDLVQCSAEVRGAVEQAQSLCGSISVLAAPGVPAEFTPWTATSTFSTDDGSREIDCRTEPAGCVAGVITLADPAHPEDVLASAFYDVSYQNVMALAPNRRLADGDTITVTGKYMGAGDWSLVQCAYSPLDPIPIDPDSPYSVCAATTPVTVDADGTFTADFVVHEPMATSHGDAACGSEGCVVALISAIPGPLGRAADMAYIAFGPTAYTMRVPSPLPDGTLAPLFVQGGDPGTLQVHQCALPLGATLSDSRCRAPGVPLTLDEVGNGRAGASAAASFAPATGGPSVDCRAHDCAFVAFPPEGGVVGQWPTLAFTSPSTATLVPASGLLEGTDMALTIDNLYPSSWHYLQQCRASTCGSRQTVIVGADGTLRVTATASQRIDADGSRYAYCRSDCEVVATPYIPAGPERRVPYAMADGALAASPDEGLSDGQTVAVTGTDLMPTYDGPPLWIFPTGDWALTQCDGAIVDDATLAGMLTHCATAPTTRVVDVAGSTLDTTVTVRSTITRILGGTTDCAAVAGACVVGLVRLEQDGSVSTHLAPVSFG